MPNGSLGGGGEILKFLTRLELERCQLVVSSSVLSDQIQRIVTELGLLRYIAYDPAPQGHVNVDIHLADAHEPADYSIHGPVSRDDVEGLLRRLPEVYINWFFLSCVIASNSTNSLEHMITLWQTVEQDERDRATFRIGTVELLVPEADDDFDYAIMDFLGAVVKPDLIKFNICFHHAGDENAVELLERESFRGRSFEIDIPTELLLAPERLLDSTMLARTCDFRLCDVGGFPSLWVDAFIRTFEIASPLSTQLASLGTQLEEVTVQWSASDDGALPGERLKTPPAKKDVPLPRHDFVHTRTTGDRRVVRSKCALHEFVNGGFQKRLEVYSWTTESDFVEHALLFKIVTL